MLLREGGAMLDTLANYSVIFLLGMLAGVITMLAVDEYHSRADEKADDYDY